MPLSVRFPPADPETGRPPTPEGAGGRGGWTALGHEGPRPSTPNQTWIGGHEGPKERRRRHPTFRRRARQPGGPGGALSAAVKWIGGAPVRCVAYECTGRWRRPCFPASPRRPAGWPETDPVDAAMGRHGRGSRAGAGPRAFVDRRPAPPRTGRPRAAPDRAQAPPGPGQAAGQGRGRRGAGRRPRPGPQGRGAVLGHLRRLPDRRAPRARLPRGLAGLAPLRPEHCHGRDARPGRRQAQPRPQGQVRAPARRRQAPQGRPDRRHAPTRCSGPPLDREAPPRNDG